MCGNKLEDCFFVCEWFNVVKVAEMTGGISSRTRVPNLFSSHCFSRSCKRAVIYAFLLLLAHTWILLHCILYFSPTPFFCRKWSIATDFILTSNPLFYKFYNHWFHIYFKPIVLEQDLWPLISCRLHNHCFIPKSTATAFIQTPFSQFMNKICSHWFHANSILSALEDVL